MSYRTTLALAVLFAASLGVYFGVDAFRTAQERQVQEARRLTDWTAESVTSLRVQQLGQPAVAAVRGEDGGWRITAPNETIRAYAPLWERVAKAASELRNERTVEEDGRELQRFGLADPVLRVTAVTEGGEEFSVAFGAQEPTRTYRYALLDGSLVFLAPENQYFEMNRSLKDLRHRFLVDDRESPVLRIEFAHIWTGEGEIKLENPPALGEESEAIVLERESADSPWRQTAPVTAPANQELADELAQEIQFGLAQDHIDTPTDLSDYGLRPARARLTVATAGDGPPVTVYFGELDLAGERGLFARRVGEDAVFLMDPHIISLWPRMTDHFRERRLFTGNVTDLERVEYEGPEGRFTLVKDGEGWTMTEPDIPDTDPQAITNFFVRLKGVEAQHLNLEEGEADPLDAPTVAFTLHLENETEPRRVLLSDSPDETGRWLVRQDTGAKGRTRADDAQALLFRPDQFRSMTLFRFDQPRAKAIDFVFEDRGYTLEKVHGRWVVRAPENHVLQNQQDAETILGLLNPLTAVSGMAEPPLDDRSAYGLDQPVFTGFVVLASEAEGGAEERLGPVMIGRPSAENAQERYAIAEGKAGIFRVRQEFIHRLRDALRGIRPEQVSAQ